MQKELEEAASEVKVVNAERLGIFESPLLSSSIPTKVHSKFVSDVNETKNKLNLP